jgi:hypothetical protein
LQSFDHFWAVQCERLLLDHDISNAKKTSSFGKFYFFRLTISTIALAFLRRYFPVSFPLVRLSVAQNNLFAGMLGVFQNVFTISGRDKRSKIKINSLLVDYMKVLKRRSSL